MLPPPETRRYSSSPCYRVDPRLGARLVEVAARGPRDADARNGLVAGLDGQAAGDHEHVRDVAQPGGLGLLRNARKSSSENSAEGASEATSTR